jgi:hypothetical protein
MGVSVIEPLGVDVTNQIIIMHEFLQTNLVVGSLCHCFLVPVVQCLARLGHLETSVG